MDRREKALLLVGATLCAAWLMVVLFLSDDYRWRLRVEWGSWYWWDADVRLYWPAFGPGYQRLALGWLFVAVVMSGLLMALRVYIGKRALPKVAIGGALAKAAMPRWAIVTLSVVVSLVAIVVAQWAVRCLFGRC